MVICINDGTSYNIKIPLNAVLLIQFLLFCISLFTLLMYNGQKYSRFKLCKEYGIVKENSNGSMVILFGVFLFISLTITANLLFKSIINKTEKPFDRVIKPLVGFIISIGFLVGLIFVSQEVDQIQGDNQDPEIIAWCMDDSKNITGIVYPASIIFGIITLSVIAVLSTVFHRKCAM